MNNLKLWSYNSLNSAHLCFKFNKINFYNDNCSFFFLNTYLIYGVVSGVQQRDSYIHMSMCVCVCVCVCMGSQVVLVVKNPPAHAGNVRDAGLIPGSGRSPGGGNGNPLQYSCVIYILFKIIFHCGLLLQDIEYRSLCYTVGPCYLFYMQ